MKQRFYFLFKLISIFLVGCFMQMQLFAINCPPTFATLIQTCENSPTLNEFINFGVIGTTSFTLLSGPFNGTVVYSAGPVTSEVEYNYFPNTNFSGTDSFIFLAGFSGTGGPCNVTGMVQADVYAPITANNLALTGCGVTSLTGMFEVNGANFPIASYSASTPSHGTVSQPSGPTSPLFVYTADTGYNGPDSFVYTASYPFTTCPNATASVNISLGIVPIFSYVNPAYVCRNGSITEFGSANINADYSILSGPTHGSASISGFVGTGFGFFYTYSPTAGYTGPDSFVFEALADPGFCTGTGVVNLNVISQVVAEPLAFTGCAGNITGMFMPVGGSGTYTFSATGASHGIITQPSGSSSPLFQYIPNLGYSGPDSFVYRIQDQACSAATASVGVFIDSGVTANNLSFTTIQETTSSHTVTATGGAGGYTYRLPSTSVQGGTIVQTSGTGSGNFNYTPLGCYAGPDSFTFTVVDSTGCISNTATVSITVVGLTAPSASPNFPTACPNGMVLGSLGLTGGSGTYTTFTLITPPTFGQIINVNLTAGTYLYEYTDITASFTDSFSFIITDSAGCSSDIETASIFLLGSPQGPVAKNLFLNVCEDGSVNGVFQVTGSAGPQIYTILTPPTNGTVTDVIAQNFVYTPNHGYTGPDLFTYYYAGIAPCLSLPAAVSINVLSTTAPTITTSLSLTACAGGSVSAFVNPTGGTSPYLSLIQQQAAHGSATGSGFSTNPRVTYVPNAGFSGVDSFVYQVEDSSPIACFSLTGLATVNVLSNSAPMVQSFTLLDCQAATITSNFTASGGTPPYSFTYMDGPSHGTITAFNATTGQFTYQPNAGYSGPDSLIYSVADTNTCGSFTATVGIIVDAPIIVSPLSLTGCADMVISGQIVASGGTPGGFNCTVPIGQQCLYRYSFSDGPSHGTLNPFNINTGRFVYTPTSGFSGSDSFEATATDILGCSGSGTVDINIFSPPMASPLSLSGCSGSSIDGTFPVTGGDGHYTFTTSTPAKGFVTLVGSNKFVYTPISAFTGTDSFTYTAIDTVSGCGTNTGTSTVTITFSGTCSLIVDPPVLDFTTCFDIPVAGSVTGSGGIPPYVFNYYNGPSHGTLSPFSTGSGAFVYNPSAGFSGQDTFVYQLTDSIGVSSSLTPVVITVESEITVPNISLETCSGSCRQGMFSATGGTGSYVFNTTGSGPSHGEVFVGQNGTFTYCANPGFSGSDSFSYYAADGFSCSPTTCVSVPGTVNVTVGFAMPTAVAYSLSSCMNGSVTAIFAATGGSGSYTFSFTQPSNGTITLGNNNSFTYQPITGFVGTDSFTYTATDLVTGCTSSPALVTITVNSTAAPVALSVGITGCAGVGIAGVYDATGGSGTYTLFTHVGGPTQGGIIPTTSASPLFAYTSNATAMGSDSFTYTVEDSNSCISNLGTVGVTLDNPFANNETFSVSRNATASGLLSGSSGIGSFSYAVNSPSTHGGTVTLPLGPTSPLFDYTTPLNFTGADTFTYTVTDSYCTSSPGTVTMNVISLSSQNMSVVACENVAVQIILSVTGGVSCYTYNVPLMSARGGSLTQPLGNCAPTVIYTPPINYTGLDNFAYTVTDEVGNVSSPATVTINVNSDPVASGVLVEGCIGSQIAGNFVVTGGSGVYTYTVVAGSGPSFGQVELVAGTSTFLYLQTGGVGTQDTFNYLVTDSNGCIGQGSVRIITHSVPIANSLTIFGCTNVQLQSQLVAIGGSGNYINYTVPTVSSNGGLISHPVANSPQFTYTPPLNFIGTDTFTYSVEDSNLCTSKVGVITIVVDSPTGRPLSLTGCGGNSISGTLTASGGIPGYIFAFANGPSDGTLSPFSTGTGAFTYNPTASFGGTDSFTYTITDNNGLGCKSSPQTVSLFVDKITANSTGLSSCTNGSVSGQLNVQGGIGALTYSQTGTGPAHGTLSINPSTGAFVYSPTAGFTGLDSFSYVVTDSLTCTSNVATVVVSSDQPIANPVNLVACTNMTAMGTLSGTGGIGNLSYLTPTVSNNGGAVGNSGGPTFTYVPPPIFPGGNSTGMDAFSYWVVDSLGCISATGTVSITVEQPIATNLSFIACANSSLSELLVGAGSSGTFTSYEIVTEPLSGTIESFCESTGAFVYEPSTGFIGTDTFTYTVADSFGCVGNIGTVTLNVQQPSANPLLFNSCAGGSLNGSLSSGAIGGTGIYTSFALVSQPTHGTIILFNSLNGNFTYVPDQGFSGFDNFIYTVTDSAGCVSNSGVVTIQIGNLAVVKQSFESCVDTTLTGQLSAVGGTGTYTSYAIVTPAQHGNVVMSSPSSGIFKYTPNNGYVGIDSFTAVVTDSSGCTSLPTTIFITVSNPCVSNINIEVCENVAFTGFLSATGGTGSYIFSFTGASPAHGTLVMLEPAFGQYVYTPTANFSGTDSFGYVATDSAGCVSNLGTVFITTGADVVGFDNTYNTCENGFLQATAGVTGGAGFYVFYSLTGAGPVNGTILSFCQANGAFTYVPNNNFIGTDHFSYIVIDGSGCESNTITATVNVNAPPIALPLIFPICEGGSLMGELTATGGSGTYVTYSPSPTSFNGGTIISPSGSGSPEFLYTAPGGFTGFDGFNYTVTDSNGCTSECGTVLLGILPAAIGVGIEVPEIAGILIGGQLQAVGGVPPYTFALATLPSQGTATVSSSGVWTYISNQTASGTDMFTFSVTDASGCVTTMSRKRSPIPNNTVIIEITGSGYPFDIIPDACPL